MKQIGIMEDGVFRPLTDAAVEWQREFGEQLNVRITIARHDLDVNDGLDVIDHVLGKARRDLIEAAMKRRLE